MFFVYLFLFLHFYNRSYTKTKQSSYFISSIHSFILFSHIIFVLPSSNLISCPSSSSPFSSPSFSRFYSFNTFFLLFLLLFSLLSSFLPSLVVGDAHSAVSSVSQFSLNYFFGCLSKRLLLLVGLHLFHRHRRHDVIYGVVSSLYSYQRFQYCCFMLLYIFQT